MRDAQLVVVRTFGSRAEAELARSALAAAGIDAMVRADSCGDMRPWIAWAGSGFQVIVREEDAAEAHDILNV